MGFYEGNEKKASVRLMKLYWLSTNLHQSAQDDGKDATFA
ncbi:hypothetical protein NSP_15150 [Nodularia spumigena CCY9414]|jgi:hypothetical protein|nr:hypothetical protein NSP_15150 [Nodularia spumigena CCY9414]EAW46794.1 hypothetical protein N9414_17493 [Nodularia spumigena CCY9414]